MKKHTKRLLLGVVTVTAVLLALTSVGAAVGRQTGSNALFSAVDYLFYPVQRTFSGVAHRACVFFETLSDAKAYRLENERLKAEVASLNQTVREATSGTQENQRLRALLELKKEKNELDTVASRVIAWDQDVAFRIDKGANDRIQKNDAVITYDGLVGKVTAVHQNSATVVPVTQQKAAVGVKVVRNQMLAIAQGTQLASFDAGKKLTLSCLSEDKEIVVGDVLETSGLGGIYPAGVLVGTVCGVTKNSAGEIESADVTLSADPTQLHEVLVVRRSKE